MIDSLAMICHVLKTSAVAAETVNCVPMLLKDEFIVKSHRVKAGHYMSNLCDFGRHNFLHDSQHQMHIDIIALITYFILLEIITV